MNSFIVYFLFIVLVKVSDFLFFPKERINFITFAGNSTLKSLGLQGMEIKEEFGLEYFQILPILINK